MRAQLIVVGAVCAAIACTSDAPDKLATAESAVTWTTVTSQGAPRLAHAAAKLSNGKVLVAGGELDGGGRNTATFFDPTTNVWTPTATMVGRHAFHCMVLLPADVALVVGGIDASETSASNVAETWDEKSNTWRATSPMLAARRRHACVLLSSGKVLVVGGEAAGAVALKTAELFDPATRTFAATAPMATERKAPMAALLADGRVLVASTGTAELFDPATSTWTSLAGNGLPEVGGMVRLASGKVLLAGYATTTSTMFDPATNSFAPTGGLAKKRAMFAMAVLANGHLRGQPLRRTEGHLRRQQHRHRQGQRSHPELRAVSLPNQRDVRATMRDQRQLRRVLGVRSGCLSRPRVPRRPGVRARRSPVDRRRIGGCGPRAPCAGATTIGHGCIRAAGTDTASLTDRRRDASARAAHTAHP